MGRETGISWTDATWNPIRGCSRVSEGCRNCYAEGVAYRFSGPGGAYEGLVRIGSDGKRRREWNGKVQFVEKHLQDPLKWKEPKRIFVNSMSDLFHENVTDEMRDKIFAVIGLCIVKKSGHQFQVLTKRPQVALRYYALRSREWAVSHFMAISGLGDVACDLIRLGMEGIHLGVSCEDQATADERIPLLLQAPAAVRFISAEPLLDAIDLACGLKVAWQCSGCHKHFSGGYRRVCPVCGKESYWTGSHAFNPRGGQVGSGIDWVIVGGESGPGARPMHPDWARSLRDQCQAAGVAFHFKQWGEYAPIELAKANFVAQIPGHVEFPDGTKVMKLGTKNAGATLDGREWHEFPGVKEAVCPA